MKINTLLLTLAVLFGFASCKGDKQLPPKEEIVSIAEEAYTFGIPYVLEYRTMYMQAVDKSSPSYVGFGKFLHYGAASAKDKDVMTPNRDTPYSWAWFDLRTEPWVLTVPPIDGKDNRYYTFQINDLAGFVVDNVSSLNDGYEGGSYLIAPTMWNGNVPEGIKRVIKGETEFMVAFARTELFDDADIVNVKKIQEGYKIQPLSAFIGKEAPKPETVIDYYKFEDGKTDVDAVSFFDCLSFVLQFSDPNELDRPILDKMAKIGIEPGADFAKFAAANPIVSEAVKEGMKHVIDTLNVIATQPLTKDKSDITPFENRSVMQTNYMDRAIGAYLGLFGNTQKEAVYNNLGSDTEGQPLDGSKQNYTVTFTKDNMPEAKFFWSLTMYDLQSRFLVDNPINRYSIGSRTKGLKYNKDGSLTLYVQKDNPGKDKESNWLPAPNAPFYSIMRFYGPGKTVLDGTFKQPAMVKVK